MRGQEFIQGSGIRIQSAVEVSMELQGFLPKDLEDAGGVLAAEG